MLTLTQGFVVPFDDLLPLGQVAAPAPPHRLRATVLSDYTVQLTWRDRALDETGYSIERRNKSLGEAFAEIDTVGTDVETYLDVGPLDPNHEYAYRIVTIDGEFDGQASNTVVAVFAGPTVQHLHRWRRRRF